jgi:hypothetical protein
MWPSTRGSLWTRWENDLLREHYYKAKAAGLGGDMTFAELANVMNQSVADSRLNMGPGGMPYRNFNGDMIRKHIPHLPFGTFFPRKPAYLEPGVDLYSYDRKVMNRFR